MSSKTIISTVVLCLAIIICHSDDTLNLTSNGRLGSATELSRNPESESRKHFSQINYSTFKINFCHCKVNYAITTNGCKYVNSTSLEINTNGDVPIQINPEHLDWSVARPNCGPKKMLLKFPIESFVILKNGMLVLKPLGLLYPQDHYCLNFKLSSTNDSEFLYMESEVCVINGVRRCSAIDSESTSKFDLETEENVNGNEPFVHFGFTKIAWDSASSSILDLQCQQHTNEKKIPVNSTNIRLFHSRQGALLKFVTTDNLQIEYKYDEFCINIQHDENKTETYVHFCVHDDGKSQIFRKCCSDNQIYDEIEHRCLIHLKSSKINFEMENFLLSHYENENILKRFTFEELLPRLKTTYGFPSCDHKHVDITSGSFEWTVNGSVVFNNNIIPSNSYCIETFYQQSMHDEDSITMQKVLVTCSESDHCQWTSWLMIPLMCLSCVFLTITLLIYLLIPGLSTNIFEKCLMSEMLALLLSFFFFVISFVFSTQLTNTTVCSILGIVNHIAVLASFFWLSAICLDRLIDVRRDILLCSERSRFIYYSICSWGLPTVIAIVTAIIDCLPSSYDVIRPDTRITCFPGNDRLSHWVFVYIPIAILLSFNLITFSYITRQICLFSSRRSNINSGSLSVTEEKMLAEKRRERAITYIKYFVLMGLSWIAEVVSLELKSCGLWILFDAFNALRGFFIFLIFVCNKKTKVYQYFIGNISRKSSIKQRSTMTYTIENNNVEILRKNVNDYGVTAPSNGEIRTNNFENNALERY